MLTIDINQKPSDRWRRFEHKELGVSLELYGPTVDEWQTFVQRFKFTTDQPNATGMRAFIAKEWSRGITGFLRADKTPHDDTPEVRSSIFNLIPEVWIWVLNKIQTFSAWRDEGNGSSGSA